MSALLRLRPLGRSRLLISEVGYGAWPLSYNNRPSEEQAIQVLHKAIDRGVRFIDTADAYCYDDSDMHHNEKLIRKALQAYPDRSVVDSIIVGTKGVCVRPGGVWVRNPTQEQIRKAVRGSHQALCGGEKPIDLWQLHWANPMATEPDPNDSHVALEVLLGPVVDAVRQGIVRFVGLCNCTADQVRQAQKILPPGTLVSVQNRFNLWDRSSEHAGVLACCEEEGLTFFPWSPLGGRDNADGAGLLRNESTFPNLNRVAAGKGCTPEALALAYMCAKWPCLVHITSARRPVHLDDTLSSAALKVTPEEITLIDQDGDQTGDSPAYSLEQP